MTNLRALVNSVTKAINPNLTGFLQISNGFSQDENFIQKAAYLEPVAVELQVQDLSSKDLRMLDGLNLQGSEVAIYLNGRVDAVVRVTQKGGDIITVPTGPNAGVYLTTRVIEQWQGDWVKIAGKLQNEDVDVWTSSLDFSDLRNSGNFPGVL